MKSLNITWYCTGFYSQQVQEIDKQERWQKSRTVVGVSELIGCKLVLSIKIDKEREKRRLGSES